MRLQAKYDLQTDRMLLLLLQPGGGSTLAFWVMRRQWLGLLHHVTSLPAPSNAAGTEAGVTTAPARSRRILAEDIAEPVLLQGIRLKPLATGVKLVLVAAERKMGIDLPQAGITQLQSLLRQQAERAGWDVAAALARLRAATLADAVMKKAHKLH